MGINHRHTQGRETNSALPLSQSMQSKYKNISPFYNNYHARLPITVLSAALSAHAVRWNSASLQADCRTFSSPSCLDNRMRREESLLWSGWMVQHKALSTSPFHWKYPGVCNTHGKKIEKWVDGTFWRKELWYLLNIYLPSLTTYKEVECFQFYFPFPRPRLRVDKAINDAKVKSYRKVWFT